MRCPVFIEMPLSRVETSPLPPMYAWPVSVKRVILGLCIILCIAAYIAMATGFIGLATLVLGVL
jgi:hypothetical protein